MNMHRYQRVLRRKFPQVCGTVAISVLLWWYSRQPTQSPEDSIQEAFVIGTHRGNQPASFPLQYQFSLSPEPCTLPGSEHQHTFLLIFVTSRPTAFELRQTIRNTWGQLANHRCKTRLLFVLGNANTTALQRQISAEFLEHRDVIQIADFHEHYRNATQKSIAFLEWSYSNCPDATFTSKTDDDVWVNIPMFVAALRQNVGSVALFGGIAPGGVPVKRNPDHKYYLSEKEFAPDVLPEYLSGTLYAIPQRQLRKLLTAIRLVKLTYLEDLSITGIAAVQAGLDRKQLGEYAFHGISLGRIFSSCVKRDYTAIHYVTQQEKLDLWADNCAAYTCTVE